MKPIKGPCLTLGGGCFWFVGLLLLLLIESTTPAPAFPVLQHPQQLLAAAQFAHQHTSIPEKKHHSKDHNTTLIHFEEKLKQEKEDLKDELDLKLLQNPIQANEIATSESPAVDEIEKELKTLSEDGTVENNNKSQPHGHEEEEEALANNANPETSSEELPQPTQKQAQQEQERIDAEIDNENTKDSGSFSGKTYPGAARFTSSRNNGGEAEIVPPAADDDDMPSNQEEEQAELLKEPPHQNEDNQNMFTHNGQRRNFQINADLPPILSAGGNKPKVESMETILKNSGGQYSAYDIAHYVFWTGDEAGVAHAIEELIQEGMMSRENAIKFLRDIRLGIEYLQNSYANHDFSNKNKDNERSPKLNNNKGLKQIATTVKPKTAATMLPMSVSPQISRPTLSPAIVKAIENIPLLLKFNEVAMSKNHADEPTNADYDEATGRLRLADFLYAEYSLEEVIYQLAKVMFSQSLTKGSEQAQGALQRLTRFLELEGNEGRISPGLQKKVLDVLLAALSDTLAEHPEVLLAARAHLGDSISRITNN